jgi:hypothetical protein
MQTCSSDGKITVKADANKQIQLASKMNAGLALYRLAPTFLPEQDTFNSNGTYMQSPFVENAINDLDLPLIRNYHLCCELNGLYDSIDKMAIFVNKEGIPQEDVILELEPSDYTYISNKTFLTAQQWADAVSYSMSKGYGFKRWEISNEPQYEWGTGLDWAINYSIHVNQTYTAIKAVQPDAIVGAQVNRLSGWSTQLLYLANGHYDFIAGHFYAFARNTSTFENAVLTENYRTINNTINIGSQIKRYNPNKPSIYQMDTEWRLMYGDGAFDIQNGNIWDVLHDSVRMTYYIRDGYMRGATAWILKGGLPDSIVPTGHDWSSKNTSLQGRLLEGGYSYNYWMYYYMIHNTGNIVLNSSLSTGPCLTGTVGRNVDDTSSPATETFTGPQVPSMVTMSDDASKLYITMTNGNWTAGFPFEIDISNYGFTSMSGVYISGDGNKLDGDWFCATRATCTNNLQLSANANKSIITGTIPAHSVAFITLQ